MSQPLGAFLGQDLTWPSLADNLAQNESSKKKYLSDVRGYK